MISFAIGGHISCFLLLTFLLLNEYSLASKRAFSLVQIIDLWGINE